MKKPVDDDSLPQIAGNINEPHADRQKERRMQPTAFSNDASPTARQETAVVQPQHRSTVTMTSLLDKPKQNVVKLAPHQIHRRHGLAEVNAGR